ncbi:MAG: FAD-dependent oxidoreductase [Proteobacteria bacterium]|nr:FAD-dependent oxidoreductase [Pseudomonadota bacterium]
MSQTIIIGGGINGLLLGALLSHEGETVTLFEKNRFVGGRAFLYEKDGFVLDYGVHMTRLGPKSPVAKIMRQLGINIEFRRLGNSYLIDYDGQKVLFPTSPAGVFKTRLFTLKEKLKVLGLLVKIKKGRFNKLMDMSLKDWMEINNITGGIRRYFELVSASLMVCPFIEKTSAGETFRNIQKILKTGHSAEYPAHGWRQIHKTLTNEIEKSGKIRLRSKVEKVLIKDGKAVGVMVEGKEYFADRIVINIPVQEIFGILDEKMFDSKYISLCKNIVPTSAVFIDLALKDKISDINGMLYTYDPKAYGMITSNVTEGIAPQGMQLLTMFYPISLEDMTDLEKRKMRRNELWKAIKDFFPDIESHIYWKRETSLKMIDGVQVNIDQTEDKRPKSSVPGIENLYLVGDSIAAPGVGGEIGNESVLITYREMTGSSF